MAHYVISYDLKRAKNYVPVWNTLEKWGAVRLLESLWVVTLNNTPAQIRDALQTVMDNDDAMAVIELKAGSGWGSIRARDAGVAWLTSNIKAY